MWCSSSAVRCGFWEVYRQAAQPRQHQEHTDQPALLPHPNRRVGLPGRTHQNTDVPRRPAHRRQAAAAVPRRRRRGQAPARHAQRCRPAVSADRRIACPHRHPPRRTARADRRRCRPDRVRLLAAHPDRQAAQRPLHPAAPAAQTTARRLDHPPPTERVAYQSPSGRTQSTDQPPARRGCAGPHRRRGRYRQRHRPSTATYPGYPGGEPGHEP